MANDSTIDAAEVDKFAKHADVWWDKNGPLKTLHDINPLRLEYIEKHCQIAGSRVLDLGCGGGLLSEAMAHSGGLVTGIDVEENAILTAARHAKKSSLDIDYQCIAIENFNADTFPIITCLEMLEHVQDPEMVIENALRLLSPGGYLFLSTINRTLKAYLGAIVAAEYVLGLLPRQTHDFNKFIKPSELTSIIRSFNLELVDISGMSYNPLTRVAFLDSSLDINYLLVCRKPVV
ncbi:MAG: bifunctional 2-polyprenyl-6-hydroxyphenol methylase/3-demethylubiquinol 3-O-methyltransferase UbiG [Legionellaceae bacterium]|nr:bifunctional 2-polyprenyl-6-hydroxyphenol methylase/3-demethylubiquinol 3-O-methyltransferase UbiG [Legionellaceae bacterium]